MIDLALQLILVTTADWNSVQGELYRFERQSLEANWELVAPAVPVNVGKNGMAWASEPNEPLKKEGDGKSPAGIFALGPVFGHAPEDSLKNLKMPYLAIKPDLECVDDSSSRYYNQFVDASKTPDKDWRSSEKMAEIGDVYQWGIVVEYNTAPAISGLGSCIFMHVWRELGSGTAGCTAMSYKDIEELIFWLDETKKPVLLQFPQMDLPTFFNP